LSLSSLELLEDELDDEVLSDDELEADEDATSFSSSSLVIGAVGVARS
jgi:hypothetical protein